MQIYNDKKTFINRQILKDLKEMNSKKTIEATITFMKDLYNSKFLCAMLSRGKHGNNETFSPYLLRCEDETTFYFPVFTNEIEILKASKDFDDYTVYLLDFEEIVNLLKALNTEMSVAILIDPEGVQYSITPSMLQVANETLEKCK